MVQQFDIVIRRARFRGAGLPLVEIGIADGRIAAIAERLDAKGSTEIDAGGNLVTDPTSIPTFISARCGHCR